MSQSIVWQEKLSLLEKFNIRALFESSRDGICLLNMEGYLFGCQQGFFLGIVGYNIDELKRLNYRDITPPKQWVDIEESYMDDELVEQGYISSYEKQYIHKDGVKVDVELSAFRINDENIKKPIICAIVRDTSEKKKSL